MTDKLFDDFVKEKLRDHQSPVPDNMWERIMQQPAKKPKGFFYLYSTKMLLYILATFIIFGGLWYAQSGAENTLTVAEKNATDKAAAPQKNVQAAANPSALDKVAVADETTPKTVEPIAQPNQQKPIDNNTSIQQPKTATSKNAYTATTNQQQQKQNTASTSRVKYSPTYKAFQKNSFGKAGKKQGPITQPTNNLINTNETDASLPNTFHYASAALAKHQFDRKIFDQNIANNFKGLFGKIDDCPTAKGPRKNELFVEIYGSPDYVQKTTSPTNYGNLSYLKRKDSLETMRGSYTAGVRLSKTLGDHFLIKGGVQYTQVNERFDYRNENERRIVTVVTIRTIIRNPGDTITVRDTSMIEQVGTRVKTTYNRYRSIDVPILIGYEWGGDKFRASINAGLILNTYSWQQGETLDTNYIPVAFNSKTTIGFKQNIGLGLYAGISLNKKIGTDTELFFEPYFRHNLSNMTKTRSAFNQRFNAAGLTIGIRYRLASFGQHYPGK
jgi:hypothetical protein